MLAAVKSRYNGLNIEFTLWLHQNVGAGAAAGSSPVSLLLAKGKRQCGKKGRIWNLKLLFLLLSLSEFIFNPD